MKTNLGRQPLWDAGVAVQRYLEQPTLKTLDTVRSKVFQSEETSLDTAIAPLYDHLDNVFTDKNAVEKIDVVLDAAEQVLSYRIEDAAKNADSTFKTLRELEALPPTFAPNFLRFYNFEKYGGSNRIEKQIRGLAEHAGLKLHQQFAQHNIRIGDLLLCGAYCASDNDMYHFSFLEPFVSFMIAVEHPLLEEFLKRGHEAFASLEGKVANHLSDALNFASLLIHDTFESNKPEAASSDDSKKPFYGAQYLFSSGFLTSESIEVMIKAASLSYIPRDLTMTILAKLAPHHNVLIGR